MLIQVMYKNNNYDFVKADILDKLISAEAIVMFRRQTGWVRIGIDPTRKRDRTPAAKASERRAP